MTSWGKVIQGVALGMSVVALAAGCGSGTKASQNSSSAAATPTIAPDVPAFDPCKVVPASLLQSERLIQPVPDIQDGDRGIKWRGCGWVVENGDGYGATIDSTNTTLAMVRANTELTVAQELTIGGHPALTSYETAQNMREDCIANVAVKGGSLEISIDNPSSRKETGSQSACDIAIRLANGIAPSLPMGL